MSRRFLLHRVKDLTGVSGPGVVAEGIEFGDRTVVVRWRGKHRTTTTHESLDSVKAIHLHGGSTSILWCDPAEDGPRIVEFVGPDSSRKGWGEPTEWLQDGWDEPNGATDQGGCPLWVGQSVRLFGISGEVANEGEVCNLYTKGEKLSVVVYGADCSPTAYPPKHIVAIETCRKQTLERNGGKKPKYGWAPALTIPAAG